MQLSVVIPTHDRPQALRHTLAALAEQTLPRGSYELLVVDDGSREENREAVRRLREEFDFELVEKPQGGLASARNRGAAEAKGAILLFLDDDVIPTRDALAEHLASHEAEAEPVAVVGSLPYPEEVVMTSFLWYVERSGHYDLYKYPDKYEGGAPPMPPMNGNASISRALFEQVGRYDESFRQYGSEDLELGYRLAQAGVRFVYNPRAVGFHNHTKDFPQFCVDMETAGESLIRVYRKYPAIRAAKKIDIVEDPLARLPKNKRLAKIVMETTFALPWLLALPRAAIRLLGGLYALRRPLFPCYRWVAHYHYAVGMRRALGR
jgi:GT2 family glycosyltransferase